MIQIFPSRMPGEALEIHRHGRTTIDGWLRSNVPSYPGQGPHPIETAWPRDRFNLTKHPGLRYIT